MSTNSFSKSNLELIFSNLERVDSNAHPHHYAVVNEQGSTIAQIVFFASGEMSIEVDNFPAEKQYFISSIPVLSLADFVGDLKRVGVNLIENQEAQFAKENEASKSSLQLSTTSEGFSPELTSKNSIVRSIYIFAHDAEVTITADSSVDLLSLQWPSLHSCIKDGILGLILPKLVVDKSFPRTGSFPLVFNQISLDISWSIPAVVYAPLSHEGYAVTEYMGHSIEYCYFETKDSSAIGLNYSYVFSNLAFDQSHGEVSCHKDGRQYSGVWSVRSAA